jgi:hypothetical protein
MNPSDWLASLPPSQTDWAPFILEAAKSGLLVCEYATIKTQWRAHTLKLGVATDALHVVLDDGTRFRPPMSARLSQQVADLIGAHLPTELVADVSYDQATLHLTPCLMSYGPEMSSKAHAVEYNAKVEAKRNGAAGLCRSVGKHWVLTSRLYSRRACAANYGWHVNGATYQGTKTFETHNGERVLQPLSTAHQMDHVDYSQVFQPMSSQCEVDGEVMATVDVMRSPDLYGLISYEQRFPLRMPGVE